MNTFNLQFEENWFTKSDIIMQEVNVPLAIISNPKRKWWKFLLQVYSCHWYKAPWEYKVKVL